MIEGGVYINNPKKISRIDMPLISVLIVTYNADDYLEEALKSIFSQTYENIELIVIDGASTDKTVKILEKYSHKIDYWKSEPDKGQSNAFNKGFSLCNGRLLTWLNADEVYTSDAIEKVVKAYRNKPHCSWFSAGIVFADRQLRITKMRKGEGGTWLLPKIGILNVYGSSTFFTKKIYDEAGGMNEDLHFTMDTDLWWRFIANGERLCRVSHYVCVYRLHEKSKTANYVVTGTKRKPEHQFEIDRIKSIYLHKGALNFSAKITRNIFRAFSFSYVISVIDSVRHRGKYVKEVLRF